MGQLAKTGMCYLMWISTQDDNKKHRRDMEHTSKDKDRDEDGEWKHGRRDEDGQRRHCDKDDRKSDVSDVFFH